ncbi:MAG: type II toxin-antitoxin system RelE/ParE family toxin [Deltaproteobacteria bacterium]
MTVRFNKVARNELAAQIAYIAAVNPIAATRLVAEVRSTLTRIDTGIVEGSEVVLAKSGRRLRRWPVPPLVLYYRRMADAIRVVRVRHGAQRPIAQSV